MEGYMRGKSKVKSQKWWCGNGTAAKKRIFAAVYMIAQKQQAVILFTDY